MVRLITMFAMLAVALAASGCKEDSMAAMADLNGIDWDTINAANIYFGHQSVGFNLLNGLKLIQRKYPQFTLPIHAVNEVNDGSGGIFHKQIGKNFDPQSKLEDFFTSQDRFAGENSVVAMKFCYVDVVRDTDVEKLFANYRARVTALQETFPERRIIHFTVPLNSDESSVKLALKKLLGKRVRGGDNVARAHYNRLLLETYGADNVFDIARAESTAANDRRIEGAYKGQHYYAMNPLYTEDGGHLNDYGKEFVATEFIKFLSKYL